MDHSSQHHSNTLNCNDFWSFRTNDTTVSAMPHRRDFHMDNIFAAERAIISAPYHFGPLDDLVKTHITAFPDSSCYPVANSTLEDLHQQVMSFHHPTVNFSGNVPKSLDIDEFLDEVFEDRSRAPRAIRNGEVEGIFQPPPSLSSIQPQQQHQQPAAQPQPPPPPPLQQQQPQLILPCTPPASVAAAAAKPEAPPKKRVTKAYSPCQKIQYVDMFRREHEEKGRSFSQRQFARKYQLSHARFSAWCKEYDKLKSLDASQLMVSRVRMPSARFPVLESRVSEWIEEQRAAGHDEPTIKAIQTFARDLATRLGIIDFVASNTWVERFRRRCDNKPPPPVTVVRSPDSEVTLSSSPRPVHNPPERMIGHILHDYLERGDTRQSPLEMAGLGLAPGMKMGGEEDTGKGRRVYTEADREKFLELYRAEKLDRGLQCSLRLFCKRHNVSRTRMTAWLKQEDVIVDEPM
ncbi:uncharacterized protein LOC129592649 [Paramacrobiotus metropolitanus]|uniref:uncharacterized protein LOC129592649 n=1 Tax=Paramacrobiotus metropolitanus TaxID=2943436 RepID=UPI0024456135|nr:uncharacterized protein LOC129592649 [Paramacrobiotus metropolitanus]